jgi:hypothetical protein
MSCGGPPERLWNPHLKQCGSYLTHRPHLSMYPYRNNVKVLYPASNPAKYAAQFTEGDYFWNTPDPTALPQGCNCPGCTSCCCYPKPSNG